MKVQHITYLLRQSKKTIAVAESCSGGLIAHTLTNVNGSSTYFKLGIVAYSNQAKTRLLGIASTAINRYGAVSQPIAKAMAKRVRQRAHTDIGLASTGIAGPTGGTKTKPVGTVYIALAYKDTVRVQKFRFRGSRLRIKQQTANNALKLIKRCLTRH